PAAPKFVSLSPIAAAKAASPVRIKLSRTNAINRWPAVASGSSHFIRESCCATWTSNDFGVQLLHAAKVLFASRCGRAALEVQGAIFNGNENSEQSSRCPWIDVAKSLHFAHERRHLSGRNHFTERPVGGHESR